MSVTFTPRASESLALLAGGWPAVSSSINKAFDCEQTRVVVAPQVYRRSLKLDDAFGLEGFFQYIQSRFEQRRDAPQAHGPPARHARR
jgi:hypothetical protein